MPCIGWSSLLRPALCWYRLVDMRAAGSLILPGEAISPTSLCSQEECVMYSSLH